MTLFLNRQSGNCAESLESMGEVYVANFGNGMIAVVPQQHHYLIAEGVAIDQKGADIG